MRFLMLLKADKDTEAGVLPTDEELETMAKYNEELVEAGVMIDGLGLWPSSAGARVTYENGKHSVTDGPFPETKELLAGYWMIEVDSKEEAIEWAKRCPWDMLPSKDRVPQIEIRRVYELEDFEPGEGLEHHRELQREIERQKGGAA